MSHPKHYCGIVGIFGTPNASRLSAIGLQALQHRGEEGAGIVSIDQEGNFHRHKDMGLVANVFSNGALEKLTGEMATGHNRYSTTGGSGIHNVQPLESDYKLGRIAISHNGNLVNTNTLRAALLDQGAFFHTTADTELMLHLLARSEGTLTDAIKNMMKQVSGAYSLVIQTKDELVGVRDPKGMRPLCLGRIDDAYILASETCALDLMGASFIRDIEPGEIVIISRDGIKSERHPCAGCQAFCIFELVYFMKPNSMHNGRSVYSERFKMGEILHREHPCDADIIVPVPDSGIPAAYGFAYASCIPIVPAFVRSHYVGRSFIQPEKGKREDTVVMKLALINELVADKRVILVDDSVVRGITCISRVRNLRRAGAKEVHIRVSCPPHRHPCHYGIDFPDRKDLIAHTHQGDELTAVLGVDSIGYLSESGLLEAVGGHGYCMACFTGQYPIPITESEERFKLI